MLSNQKSSFSIANNFGLKIGFRFPNLKPWTTGEIRSNAPGEELSLRRILAVGDLNNDGLDDLTIVYNDVIVEKPLILISKGDGTFYQEGRISGNSEQRSAREAKIVDVNRDGFKDIVYFPASHGWKENILGQKWNAFDPVLLLINNSGNGFFVNSSMLELPEGYFHSGDTGFTNLDTFLDVFPVSEYNASRAGLPRVSRIQKSDGSFALSGNLSPAILKDYQINNCAIGDLNNDGFTDYAFTIFPQSQPKLDLESPTIAFAFGNKSWDINSYNWLFLGKTWVTNSVISEFEKLSGKKVTETFPQSVNFIDLDDDGVDEIFIGYTISQITSAFQILKFTGGAFLDITSRLFPNQSSNMFGGGWPGELYRVDLNNDGVRDLIYAVKDESNPFGRGHTASNSIFINEAGAFLPVDLASYPVDRKVKHYEGFVGGDFNGDGKSDLAAISYDVESRDIFNFVSVFLNNDGSQRAKSKAPVTGQFTESAGQQIFDGSKFALSKVLTDLEFKDFDVKWFGEGTWQLTKTVGATETDYLIDIDRVVFKDLSLALDLQGAAGQTYRVYKAAFNRDPMQGDTKGLGYWIAQIDQGMGLIEVSARFVDSNEFRTLYGTNPSNAQFLTKLYQNVLGRDPEPTGFNWWLNELNTNPSKTKAKVLADFAESGENQVGVASLIGSGITHELWAG